MVLHRYILHSLEESVYTIILYVSDQGESVSSDVIESVCKNSPNPHCIKAHSESLFTM